jgi:hypothetical protein
MTEPPHYGPIAASRFSWARANRGKRNRVRFFCVIVLTGWDCGPYKAFIDGGAANEQRPKSCLRLLVTTAARLDCRGDDASSSGLGVLDWTFGLAVTDFAV